MQQLLQQPLQPALSAPMTAHRRRRRRFLLLQHSIATPPPSLHSSFTAHLFHSGSCCIPRCWDHSYCRPVLPIMKPRATFHPMALQETVPVVQHSCPGQYPGINSSRRDGGVSFRAMHMHTTTACTTSTTCTGRGTASPAGRCITTTSSTTTCINTVR